MKLISRPGVVPIAAVAWIVACTNSTGTPEGAMAFALTSTAFAAEDAIPPRHTCDGEDVSPPLSWSDPPEGTRSLALVVVDPDAPDPAAPRTTWVHWVVHGLPPAAAELPVGASPDGLPEGAAEGLNDWEQPGYRGPCPPIGRHRYYHRLYALDTELAGLERPTRAELERAMEGHVLGVAELMGTYEHPR
jgi:Raf kinase inhibitor-like YbhB/YbcL family protein